MFPWLKKNTDSMSDLEFENMVAQEDIKVKDAPNEKEQLAVAKIESDFYTSKAVREDGFDDTGYSIEDNWEDDYFLYKGGGLQWLTHFAYRSPRMRQIRPNSEDNFIFNTLTIQHANITADTPEAIAIGVETEDKEMSNKLNCSLRHNDKKNNFASTWKKWVFDFIGSGPTIAMVSWDNDWIGGRGAERWIGDVRLTRVDKWEMYFDPAISNLEDNLEDCSFIIRRTRKKLKWIRDKWENGKMVGQQLNEDELVNEGGNPQQAYVIEYRHKGFPFFMPEDRKDELLEKARQLEEEGEVFKAQDYYDSAKGDLEGIHVAYISDGVLLEYYPYEYEHGKYPFVFSTRYFDDKCQWGFGETRNIKIPQIMHNKADEIEIEAMSREGLGGKFYQKGAVNPKQRDEILSKSGVGGMWFEVDNVNLLKDRDGVKVPASITNYKEHKQRMVETVSSNTPIMQGMSPSANMPYASVKELGARSDVRMLQISNKLEDFLKKVNLLRIELFGQFYTEERYYRIKGKNGQTEFGSMKSDDIKQSWIRDTVIQEELDPITGEMVQVPKPQIEKFIPEFDIEVTVISQKPTDRNYYTNLAMQLYQMQIISAEDLLRTLEDGRLPNMEELIEKYNAMQPINQVMNEIQNMPEEEQAIANQQLQQMAQGLLQNMQTQQTMPNQTNEAPIQNNEAPIQNY